MRNMINGCVIIFLLGMVNLASTAQAYTWQDVKQEVGPTLSKPVSEAYLKIYTGSEEVNDGGYLWVRGQRYSIFSDDGKLIRSITNENTPNTFVLSPGKYVIVPNDHRYKSEIVGAVLEQGKLTEVHMLGG